MNSLSGNTVSGIHKYGVLIDQSYPSTLGTPGTGVIVSPSYGSSSSSTTPKDIQYISGNTVSVDSSATRVAVNCGSGSCTGTWNWAGLTATGGKTGTINYSGIVNYPTVTSTSKTTTTTTKASTSTSKTSTTTSKASTTTSKTTTTTTKTSTSASSTGTVAAYGQCGGLNYTGPTTCVSGYTCTYSNDYYSQCVPS
ncbi:hypothetical protein FRB90_005502 [Tulasnella sp. 427]|nr:hypothetical protein FRB90_005502 [Tulasnella sp. 427]